ARTLDLVLARIVRPVAEDVTAVDLNVEVLFHDHLVVAAGAQSRWARRQHIDLADLVDEPWILTPQNAWNTTVVAEAFRTRGLKMPNVSLVTYSVHLRTNLLATGGFITVFPGSVLRFYADRFSLKVLPVDLPARPWAVAVVTLKNRTLSAVAERFVEHVRTYTKSMAATFIPGKTATRAARAPAKAEVGEKSYGTQRATRAEN
ncbi:MAG: LysR family transcriptional regulator substrate-binding protein, partial [Burkholderiales bacterium]